MKTHKAKLSEVSDENLHCPYCKALIYKMEAEEWTGPIEECSHFKGCITWSANEFESPADPNVVEWWNNYQDEANKNDECSEMSDLTKCPYLDHVVEHSSHGMACGPVCFTVSFCFADEK